LNVKRLIKLFHVVSVVGWMIDKSS